MNSINLDKVAAQQAQEIMKVLEIKFGKDLQNRLDPKSVENLATKALGVLQEQGIYAGILFLLSRSGEKTDPSYLNGEQICACYIIKTLLNILNHDAFKEWGYGLNNGLDWKTINSRNMNMNMKTTILNHVASDSGLLENIDRLFLIKSLYEQILIYTRYSAKAAKIDVAAQDDNKEDEEE
ncbi:MAG: hypothetical protein GF353_13830 [Candidatus Lokiarchaeota archaeon]|nr:hypothetical protein [Candidatus Lokiarchaeota archaeon]